MHIAFTGMRHINSWTLMEKETLLNIIASALELDVRDYILNRSKNCEKWDSLAHLSISQQ